MAQPAYPVARAVATRIHRHFSDHLAAERERGEGRELAPAPDEAAIESIIDAAFWASLRQNERYPLKVTLAWLAPHHTRMPMTFGHGMPLNVETVTRLAPAVERPGVHLGVWREEGGEFRIWGATQRLPSLCFVLEVLAPGFLVIKHRRSQGVGKFVNVAVLEGDHIKVLDPHVVNVADSPAIVGALFGVELPDAVTDSTNVFIQLAASMRAHGRGGSLLVVPHDTGAWQESMAVPVPYAVRPAYAELAELMQKDPADRVQPRWQELLRRSVDVIGGLTAVDGAMVMTDRCELLGFGAKIGRREGWARVEEVIDAEPIEGATPRAVHPSFIGGTRHLSAAQFGHDQRDSLALVASQDGRFTVFAWSAIAQAVQAYRVEALLL